MGSGFAWAMVALVTSLGACNTDGSGLSIQATGKSPSPTASQVQGSGDRNNVPGVIGGSGSPGTSGNGSGSPSPTTSPTQQTGAGVKSVSINPSQATLNAPADDGVTTASFATSQVFTATVFLEPTGQNSQVRWSLSNGTGVATASAGLGFSVEVLPGAAEGSLVLTATSIQDPTRKATASIVITRNTQVSLDIK